MTGCRIGKVNFKNGAQVRVHTRQNGGTWEGPNPMGIVIIRNHDGPLTFERAHFLLENAKRQLWLDHEDVESPEGESA